MIPLRDINTARRLHYVTLSLIIINFLVFAYESHLGLMVLGEHSKALEFMRQYGLTPNRFIEVHGWHEFSTIITSMFIHKDWIHILANMWVLYLFGDNVEDHLGHLNYFLFYIFCGIAAQAFQLLVQSSFDGVIIGASGAIAGIMAAYLIMHPNASLVFFWPSIARKTWFVEVPSWYVILFWFCLQVASAIMSDPYRGGVGYAAHVGGFSAGLLVHYLPRTCDPHDTNPHEKHLKGWRLEKITLYALTTIILVTMAASAFFNYAEIMVQHQRD